MYIRQVFSMKTNLLLKIDLNFNKINNIVFCSNNAENVKDIGFSLDLCFERQD